MRRNVGKKMDRKQIQFTEFVTITVFIRKYCMVCCTQIQFRAKRDIGGEGLICRPTYRLKIHASGVVQKSR